MFRTIISSLLTAIELICFLLFNILKLSLSFGIRVIEDKCFLHFKIQSEEPQSEEKIKTVVYHDITENTSTQHLISAFKEVSSKREISIESFDGTQDVYFWLRKFELLTKSETEDEKIKLLLSHLYNIAFKWVSVKCNVHQSETVFNGTVWTIIGSIVNHFNEP